MNWRIVGILFHNEMKILLRDRRTVLLSILLPLVVTPLTLYAAKRSSEKREAAFKGSSFKYSISGPERIWLRTLIETARKGGVKELENQLVEVEVEDAQEALRTAKLDFHVETYSQPVKKSGQFKEQPIDGIPYVKVSYQGDRDSSRSGAQQFTVFLTNVRRYHQNQLLKQHGFEVDLQDYLKAEVKNLASEQRLAGSYLGRFATLLLVMLMLTGGSVAALDILAGEKEKGTLETLLTASPDRTEVVAAKQFAVFVVVLATTLIQLANMYLYLRLGLIKVPGAPDISLTVLLVILLFFIPLAGLVSSILLMISGYARSYKEAQLYFLPVYLLSLLPASAAFLPGVELRSAIVLLPLANVSVAVREVMVGKLDFWMLLTVFLVNLAVTVLLIKRCAGLLTQERLITVNEYAGLDTDEDLLASHIWRWYLLMWAVVFVFASNLDSTQLRAQLLFNQLVVFLLLPLLLVSWYRLDVKKVFSLQRAKPVVWIAVVLAVPSAQIATVGLFRMVNLIIPVPPKALEQFGQQFFTDVSRWELLLLVAVLPGICEEIAFRGLFLQSVVKRYGRLKGALVAALVFGLFHFQLFRIIPTAVLGLILSMFLLLSGSIFPGMLAHALNNAVAVWLAEAGIPTHRLDIWMYLLSGMLFLSCLWIVYRNREPL